MEAAKLFIQLAKKAGYRQRSKVLKLRAISNVSFGAYAATVNRLVFYIIIPAHSKDNPPSLAL